MYYLTTSNVDLLHIIDNYERFAFFHYFLKRVPNWAYNPSSVMVRVDFFKKYNAIDEIVDGEMTLIGEKRYLYHFAKRKIIIVKAFKNPTYLVLTDYVKYTQYNSVEEWVNDYCSKLPYHVFKSILYLCIHHGKRKPWRHRKRNVFLFVAEKSIPYA